MTTSLLKHLCRFNEARHYSQSTVLTSGKYAVTVRSPAQGLCCLTSQGAVEPLERGANPRKRLSGRRKRPPSWEGTPERIRVVATTLSGESVTTRDCHSVAVPMWS